MVAFLGLPGRGTKSRTTSDSLYPRVGVVPHAGASALGMKKGA
jgi:hypothetical protein